MTPDGYESASYYLYVHGQSADDYLFYTDASGQAHMVPKGSWAQVTMPDGKTYIVNTQWSQDDPMVVTPDGQTMTWNAWLAQNGGDGPANDPWMLMTDSDGQTLVVKEDQLVTDIQSLRNLGDRVFGSSNDVSTTKYQLLADLDGIDITNAFMRATTDLGGVNEPVANPSAIPPAARDGEYAAQAVLKSVTQGLTNLRQNHDSLMVGLVNYGSALYSAMEGFWETEQANARMLGLQVDFPGGPARPPAGKSRPNYS
jgi:hypothetical protein